MITRNLHNWIMNRMTALPVAVKTLAGESITLPSGTNTNVLSINFISTALAGETNGLFMRSIRIGTGTREPSYDDYDLEQRISQLDPKNIMHVRSSTYDGNHDILTAIFLNETDADWIITEVGQYLGTSMTDASKAILLAREVFDPVTVKPGQTFSVSMKLF